MGGREEGKEGWENLYWRLQPTELGEHASTMKGLELRRESEDISLPTPVVTRSSQLRKSVTG